MLPVKLFMQPESRKYLWDALQAANRVTKFVANRTLDRLKVLK